MGKRLFGLVIVAALCAAIPALAKDLNKKTVQIKVKNETGYYLVEANVAPQGESDWGDSVLGDGVTVRPSKERDVSIAPGSARLRALFDVDGTDVEVVEEADFESGGQYVWTITEDMVQEAYDASQAGTSDGDYWGGYGYYDDSYGYYDGGYGYYGE
jgi:hypothetical protein